MDDRREILIALGWRILFAIPLGAIAWFLFATTIGDSGGAWKRLLGLACVVVAAVIIAAPLAALAAQPTGSLFFPRHAARREPAYSLAEARRKRGCYEEAIDEYQRIAEQFPAEVLPYIAMMEIASANLHDRERAAAIARRGLAMLRDEASRQELLRAHRTIKTKSPAAPPEATVEPEGRADSAESDTEHES
jgi:tetratricopeptide (TPR) repeat protein